MKGAVDSPTGVGDIRVTLSRHIHAIRHAFDELLAQEFTPSVGHLVTVLNGCVFAPSLFTFWLINGALDFSTAFVIGSIVSPGGLIVRLVAYLLLIPVFLFLRISYYLLHPTHRQTILSGACPQGRFLTLDWFSVGILATGLPLALQDLGPWIGMNTIFLVGIFVIPRFITMTRVRMSTKILAIGLGVVLFSYTKYGELLQSVFPHLPAPVEVFGPIATFSLTDETTSVFIALMNSFPTGPIAVALFAVAMNWILTRDELTELPVIRHTLPRYDPPRLVVTSAALGTVFYLAVVAIWTGHISFFP